MRKKAFFRFLPTIASLGILGTYIAFAVISSLLYALSRPLSLTLAVRCPCCELAERSSSDASQPGMTGGERKT